MNNIYILDREMNVLSDGKLQRVAIVYTCSKKGNVYIFDEFTSFLDVKQRLKSVEGIRTLHGYIIIVEYYLAMLDYVGDKITIIYGVEGVYGVVSKSISPLNGINVFIDG